VTECVRVVDCDGSDCQVGLFGIKVNRRVKGSLNIKNSPKVGQIHAAGVRVRSRLQVVVSEGEAVGNAADERNRG
jgi:hypothetical protein